MTDVDGLLLGSDRTPPARTLLDILRQTTAQHPNASALEDSAGAISYRELMARVVTTAARLHTAGVRRGDRVGIRAESGTRGLYVSILGVLAAGAAYVPVDIDDPEERAALVFGEAAVCGVIGSDGRFVPRSESRQPATSVPLFQGSAPHPSTHSTPVVDPPTLDDDAWIIFTSGSTGTPKGVAVTHRSAAAFVDAEARLFLADDPIGPGDRVLAGLSVAFDASCEEMWLAWRNGACLVPASRSLVRSGADLGPWLLAHGISVVSTVPTLAALWPAESMENVRLLIFGGEACPPELAARLSVDGRQVWNTYGPTEATVVSCAALMDGVGPVRIGLPLDGWDLAVVDGSGSLVAEGGVGELIIGGVGLARYLDPVKDAQKYAPVPALGWDRAYRSGDLVRFERAGLIFQGRADDQVKVGGRRIELGEIEAALQNLPGVSAAAAAVRSTEAGNSVIVGYVAVPDPAVFDHAASIARLRQELPAALVPLLAPVEALPVRTSGKVDRDALPWPLPTSAADTAGFDPDEQWLADQWSAVLGLSVTDTGANFFDLGGGSLSAAQLVSRLRQRVPEFTMAEIYAHPRFGAMVAELRDRGGSSAAEAPRADYHRVLPTPPRMQWLQTVLGALLQVFNGLRWLTYLITAAWLFEQFGDFPFLPHVPLWGVLVMLAVFATPFGRMAIAVVVARSLLAGVQPGNHPRGGGVHLRLWLAEQVAHQVGAVSLAGAPWISYYARALGATIGPDVDLHTLPPITGMLTIGRGASVEPEVDLTGYWIDGDIIRLGAVRIGAYAAVGARSTLLPGARIGKHAEIAPGSAVFGRVPSGQLWAGSPAVRVGRAEAWWPPERPPRHTRWIAAYGAVSIGISLLPIVSLAIALATVAFSVEGLAPTAALVRALAVLPLAVIAAGVFFAGAVVVLVRLMGIGVHAGVHPVRGRLGLQLWATERLLDLSRTFLFPLYSSLFTPVWLRMMGARVGKGVEASTVLLIPAMTSIRDGAFLADDTMVAPYELGGGWLRIAEVEIGKRAFLGNSGMAAAGHRVPKDGLVAVLSAAPRTSKAGSSWLGSPPVRLRRRATTGDESRTFDPPTRLRVARVFWELLRFVPIVVTCAIGLGVLGTLAWLMATIGFAGTAALSWAVLLIAGWVAALISTAAKWALVGRIRAGEHPLWSSFVWRSEVSDTFVEMAAAPWFAQAALGSPSLNLWLRSLGARIGKGVWCDTYWLPEADLVELDRGATVNRGCVVQTHLFHDRIMSMDTVRLAEGSTLGPHSVILPAADIGAHGTVGPASLVMRGESVPVGSRFSGNPVGPWRAVTTGDYYPVED